MTNFEQLEILLQEPKNILISSHANPDGDAVGSSLALAHYLFTLGHRVNIIMPTEMPDFLDFMPGIEKIWIYEKQTDLCNRIVENTDLIFALDYNNFNRTEIMESVLANSKAYKVMIDHHMAPSDFANAMLWRTSASSTCELIYDFLSLMNALDAAPIETFETMYVGILTDTGGLQYATSPALFRLVADISERGVNINYISDQVSNSYSYKRFRLMGYSISDRLELLEDINTGIIVLDVEDHRHFNIQRGDLEGIVNLILRIRDIRCAVLITERKDRVKLSFRSKGNFSVQEICSKYFSGGGHLNASGGQSRDNLVSTVDRLKELLYTEYKAALIS
jgi:bifunctional oligoribonuclease and PAP phosphatase NrnA